LPARPKSVSLPLPPARPSLSRSTAEKIIARTPIDEVAAARDRGGVHRDRLARG
jgi:hypothetical protein